MRLSDIKESLHDFWKEFRRQKTGVVGLVLLLLLIFTATFGSYLTDFPEAGPRWRDIDYWKDNPRSAPPAWTNWFTASKAMPHTKITEYELESNGTEKFLTYNYTHEYDEPPTDFTIYLSSYYHDSKYPPKINLTIIRPDGLSVKIYEGNLNLPTNQSGLGDYERSDRLVMGTSTYCRNAAIEFASKYEKPSNLNLTQVAFVNPLLPIFSVAEEGIIIEGSANALIGKYSFVLRYDTGFEYDQINESSVLLSGSVYGVLGTDNQKRDIFAGIIGGTSVALMVGLLSAAMSVGFGIMYGITSAYVGGWKDEAMQRFNEFMYSMPMLPLLIALAAIMRPSIWILIVMIAIFGWTGVAKVARSMGLQIKEQTYVEAAHALGASGWRILFKHMIPIVAPYSFASMALFVPGAILTEAGISFLGLGDPTIATWGQILHDASYSAATLTGMWWWIVPPGLAIAVVSMTFVLIGSALDTILNPKMRRR